jgi:hypothetical protein
MLCGLRGLAVVISLAIRTRILDQALGSGHTLRESNAKKTEEKVEASGVGIYVGMPMYGIRRRNFSALFVLQVVIVLLVQSRRILSFHQPHH